MSIDDQIVSAPADGTSSQQTGNDSQPAPGSESKYDKYYKMNGDSDPAGTGSENPRESDSAGRGVKPEAKASKASEPPTDGNPSTKKEKVPDWQRRISVLTAREKSRETEMQTLRQQVAELSRAKEEGQKEQPKKLSRENYLSDAEYLENLAEQKAEEKLNSRLQKMQSESEATRNSEAAHKEFRQGWLQKIESNFPNPEDRQEFGELLKGAKDDLHTDIHDFMQNSDVGPRILKTLRLHPEFADALNKLPASVRSTRLAQVEQVLYSEVQQEYAAAAAAQVQAPAAGQAQSRPVPAGQKQKVSMAPAPTGPVGNSGANAIADEASDADAVRAYKRRKFGLA